MTSVQRIGLFGGTFDPVHFGHLRPALELLEILAIDCVRLLPNHRPAHRGKPGASAEQRIAMLRLAIEGEDRLVVDTREADRDRPSYTVDTLTDLRAEYPGASLIFFMGMDAYSHFDAWHRWSDILELANLVVVDRPGITLSEWSSELLHSRRESHGVDINHTHHGVIVRRRVTQFGISATRIRQRVAAGLDIRFLLPEKVREYIADNNLYQSENTGETYSEHEQ